MADDTNQGDLPGGTPVENDIDPPGMPEPPNHPTTAHDAWVFIRKVIA